MSKHPAHSWTCPLPPASLIAAELPGADFADCHALPDTRPHEPALASYLSLMAHTPAWMNGLMALRNRLVQPFGLKHLGRLDALRPADAASDYRVGERLGIFSLVTLSERELVLEDDDKHLRVRLSLYKDGGDPAQPLLKLSTVVHVHRGLGHAYMALVGPVHRRIVPLLLSHWMQQQAGTAHG